MARSVRATDAHTSSRVSARQVCHRRGANARYQVTERALTLLLHFTDSWYWDPTGMT
jgi:hypothetical protein